MENTEALLKEIQGRAEEELKALLEEYKPQLVQALIKDLLNLF